MAANEADMIYSCLYAWPGYCCKRLNWIQFLRESEQYKHAVVGKKKKKKLLYQASSCWFESRYHFYFKGPYQCFCMLSVLSTKYGYTFLQIFS